MSEFQLARLNAILKPCQQEFLKRLIRESLGSSYVGYNVLESRVLSELKANAKDVAQFERAAIALKKSLRITNNAMTFPK